MKKKKRSVVAVYQRLIITLVSLASALHAARWELYHGTGMADHQRTHIGDPERMSGIRWDICEDSISIMSNSILVDPVTNHRDTVNLMIKGCTKVGLAQLINPGSESRLKKERKLHLLNWCP